MDWIATVYNSEEKIVKQFLIKDRTEDQAFDEAETPTGQVEGYDDWSLMPLKFWTEQDDFSLEDVEEL